MIKKRQQRKEAKKVMHAVIIKDRNKNTITSLYIRNLKYDSVMPAF